MEKKNLHFYLVLSAIKIKYPLICILKKRAKFENILKQMCFLYYESH